MKKVNKFSEWLRTRHATIIFAMISLMGGLLFLRYNLTGRVVFGEQYNFNPLSLIGALLIICGIILGVYSLKNKKD